MREYQMTAPDELYHHGRKGQHWGVMNGPPYPLNSQGIAKFKANAKKLGDKVAKGKEAVQRKAGMAVIKISNAKNTVKAKGAARAAVIDPMMKRRAEKQTARQIKRIQKRNAKTNKKLDKQEANKNDLRNLSDDELRSRINRLNMEKQYRQLMAERAREMESGKGYVANLANKTARNMGEKAVKEISNMAVDSFVKKLKEAGKTDEAKALEKVKKNTEKLKITNNYMKEVNNALKNQDTNKRYRSGDFSDNNKKKDKDKE